MAIGLGVLRLSPESFWRMTPRELAAACNPLEPDTPLKKSDLCDLIERFPDKPSGVFHE